MDANLLRTINKLWKDRHTHDGEDFQEQITIIRQTVESQGDQVAASGTGAHLHLLQTVNQEIAPGGEAIEWDSVFSIIPTFEFDDTVPVTAVPVAKSGYYDIHVEFEWAGFAGGGAVSIERTRNGGTSTVWPSPAEVNWTSTAAQKFSGTAKGIPFVEGDLFEVFVDHGDGSAQTVDSAVLAVELVDRYTVEPEPEVAEQLFVFTEDGTFDWSDAGSPATVDVWIIAGGGAGGASDAASHRGGGGGAGGVEILTDYPVSGDCAVVVGLGGTAVADSQGGDGEDSSFDGETATGGGGGGGEGALNGRAGGSGGGAAPTTGTPGAGVAGQGNDGGNEDSDLSTRCAGGGGGYAEVGGDGDEPSGLGGDGGDGIDLSAIVGTSYGDSGWFAGGGGGASGGGTSGDGGIGGGGTAGESGTDGLVNSGGGGGGAVFANAGDGGSGIVIVRVGG